MPTDDNTTPEIEKLVVTIRELMRQAPNGWVSWPQVASRFKGSIEFVDLVCGLANLPQWRHLFAMTRTVVKLTDEGLALANGVCPPSLTEMQRIASAVVHYAGRLDPIRLRVDKVSRVAKVGNKVVQAVHVDLAEDTLPSDTPVLLRSNGVAPTRGKIVGQEPDGSVVYVAFDTEIFPEHLPAELRIDRGFLLTLLANQIEPLPSIPERMKPILSSKADGLLIANNDSLDVGTSLASLPAPWTRLLWGPPGAGKTFALAHLVASLLKADPRRTILLVAPSNRAVDVALEQIVARLVAAGLGNLIQDRKVLRFGYPRRSQIIERAELLGPIELDGLNKEVGRIARLIEKAGKEEKTDVEIALLRTEFLAAQEAVKTAVAEHVKKAAVVATTTTLAYLPTSPVSCQQWDTVLVDEITMVTPAMCTFLASQAQHRFLLAGDPRQLGPVYESGDGETPEDFEWMGRDIFDKSGVSSGVGEDRRIRTDDCRLARITSQRRCASGIWGRVKHLYPEIADATNHAAIQSLIQLLPSPGESVVCLDTSGVQAKCERYKGSWQNPLSAELAMDVAMTIAAESPNPISIAIITPYRAQVRLLRQFLREERKAEITPYARNEIEAGTVHQFQGSDADVVIFDVVDGKGRQKPGKLLRSDDGIRLVNVAITRAKGKLVVIADKEWCKTALIHNHNALLGELILGKRPSTTIPVYERKRQDAFQPGASHAAKPSPERDKTESPIERGLFEAMAKHPMLATVECQYRIRDRSGTIISRADFAFAEIKYAVYCDGRQWHLREDRWELDLRQRNKLTETGWIFSVFTGRQINKNADACAMQIAETYMKRVGENAPPKHSHKANTGKDVGEQGHKEAQSPTTQAKTAAEPSSRDENTKFTNSLGLEFAWIAPGSFLMGSSANEKEREVNEDQHKVRLSKGFFMGIHPVTQAQWRTVMGVNPSRFQGDTLPVEQVSWHECIEFCKKLTVMDGKQYRLPSEAEWEYACRAGTLTPFHFGETISTDEANFDGKYVYGKGKEGPYRQKTTPVDSFPPNSWGLYDLHGNVWEWCSDWHSAYPTEDAVDYQGPLNGTERVIRGGAWNQIPRRCRSAHRDYADPRKRRKDIGIRVCFSES